MNQRPARTHSRHGSNRQHHGFTLIEAVLAVLLVSSAAIGIAALYAHSAKVARGGKLHQDAVALAEDIAAVIRQHPNSGSSFETRIGATCESTERDAGSAAHAVACWQEKVATTLTNGSSRIALEGSGSSADYVIVVSWAEPRTGTASYVLRVSRGEASLPSPPTSPARG